MKIKFKLFREHWIYYLLLSLNAVILTWTVVNNWTTPYEEGHYIFKVLREDNKTVYARVGEDSYSSIKSIQLSGNLYFNGIGFCFKQCGHLGDKPALIYEEEYFIPKYTLISKILWSMFAAMVYIYIGFLVIDWDKQN